MSTAIERQQTAEDAVESTTDAGLWIMAGSCLLFLAHVWVLRGFVTDDSWISVRYAENLGSGAGLGWNPDSAPVEGFSNPLLVLFEAFAHAQGFPALGSARVLGVAAGLGCVVGVYLLGRRVVGERAAAIATVLTATCAPLVLWSVGGLETSIVALLLLAAVLEMARDDRDGLPTAAWLLAPLPWLRPEAVAVAGVLIVAAHLVRPWRRPVWRSLVKTLAPVVGAQILLEVVRLAVYGHLVPNSALYKVGTGDALEVPMLFIGEHQLVLVAALLAVFVVRGRQRLLVVAPVVYLLGSIGTRDSANGWSRFFVPIWPEVALLAGLLLAAVLARVGLRHWRWTAIAAATVAVATVALLPARLPEVNGWQQAYMDCKVAARKDMISWLLATPRRTVFAISDAGFIPARADGREAIDSFMLNDAELQTTGLLAPGVRAQRVYNQEPDVLILASSSRSQFIGVYETDQLLHDNPDASKYPVAKVTGGGPDCAYSLWAFES